MIKKIVHVLILLLILLSLTRFPLLADTSCGNIKVCVDQNLSCSPVNGGPSACEQYLLNKKTDLHNQADTLSAQIAVMDNQISLTEARIESTKQQISDLNLDIDTATKKVNNLQNSLNDLIKVLLNRMVATYEIGQTQPFGILLSSTNATNFFSRLNYLKVVQTHDKQLIYLTQQAKTDYSNQKNIFEDKKKKVEALKVQLESYTQQLDQNKQAKQQLLTETQGNEATYAGFLAQVRALVNFSVSTFGTSLVPHRDLSDGFGKYYNQRDTNWGNNPIGYSNFSVAAAGCTLTSYAMVVSHYGGSLTPADVAADASNFSGALFRIPGPSANGHAADYRCNPSLQDLRGALNSGAVVVAGLSMNGGTCPTYFSDHWVVLRSVEGDSFRINDPEYDGAMNVLLTDHYSGWKIIEARIYQ